MRTKDKAMPSGMIGYRDFIGKHVVNLYDGVRLCTLQDCDFVFHMPDGQIESILVPSKGAWPLFRDKKYLEIPWGAIQKIGKEMIIVDLEQMTQISENKK